MSTNIESKENIENDYLDLAPISNFIGRSKKTILTFVILFGFFGAFYSLTIKKLWGGEFQIVIEDNQKKKDGNSLLFELSKAASNSSQTGTLIGILGSPSVLMPIYTYYGELKESKNIKFKDWKKNLLIEKEKDTNILTIKYRDNNKNNILPILNKLSNTYQQYSNKIEKRDLENKYNNIIKQVNVYRERRNKSLDALTSFAFENDMGINEDNNEKVRINAISTVRNLEKQIERLRFLKNNETEDLFYALNNLVVLKGNQLLEEVVESPLTLTISTFLKL